MRSRVCKCNPPFGFGGRGHSLGEKGWGRVPIRTRGQTHHCGTLGTVYTRMHFRGKIYRVRSSKFNCLHAHSCTKSRIASTPRILSTCAAEYIFCCPTENSHHLKAWILSKNALFHNEKESKRIQARCQVSLEKSSKNYSCCENEPSQEKCIASPLPHFPVNRRVFLAGFPRDRAESAK